jgi:hypothetical protein
MYYFCLSHTNLLKCFGKQVPASDRELMPKLIFLNRHISTMGKIKKEVDA